MQFTIAVLALAGSAVASAHEPARERAVDPASASLALFGALPSSLAGVAITNPAAAATIIQGEFATGTPSWFGKLPADVQTYFLTAQGAAAPPAATAPSTAVPTGGASNSTATNTGTYKNGTTSATGTASATKLTTSASTGAATTAAASSAAKASSSSTAGASLPTGMVGAGIAGAAGLLAMLAL